MDDIRDERKGKKKVPSKNKKTSWNKILWKKSHERNKYLYSNPSIQRPSQKNLLTRKTHSADLDFWRIN